jgi:hypothetical protein
MKYVRIFFWLMCAVCFFSNFYVWGGIKDTPHVGDELMRSAPKESFLAATYMVVGSKVNGTLGQTRSAVDSVARKFPDLVNTVDFKTLTVDKFKDAQDPWGRFCYTGAPLLVLLSLVLHWTRQKQVASLGGIGSSKR